MASEERKEAFLRAWFDVPEGVHWAHGMSNEIEQNVSDCFDKAIAAWNAVAPVSPDATGTVKTFNQIIDYVMRYGGRCRDCADEDGVCPTNRTPCEPKVKRAVIEHTLKSLEYGLSHGFIENPFSLPAPDATGKCGELETVGYMAKTRMGWIPSCASSGGDAVVTRSQAVELLAAERAEKDEWRKRYHTTHERLLEVDEKLHTLEADNAALTARVKEWQEESERKSGDWFDFCKMIGIEIDTHEAVADAINTARSNDGRDFKALEAKLEAAEKALEQLRSDCQSPIDLYERNGPEFTSPQGNEYESTSYVVAKFAELVAAIDAARAALGGKP